MISGQSKAGQLKASHSKVGQLQGSHLAGTAGPGAAQNVCSDEMTVATAPAIRADCDMSEQSHYQKGLIDTYKRKHAIIQCCCALFLSVQLLFLSTNVKQVGKPREIAHK